MSYTLRDIELHSDREGHHRVCSLVPVDQQELLEMLNILHREHDSKAVDQDMIWIGFKDKLFSSSQHQPEEMPYRVSCDVGSSVAVAFNLDLTQMNKTLN